MLVVSLYNEKNHIFFIKLAKDVGERSPRWFCLYPNQEWKWGIITVNISMLMLHSFCSFFKCYSLGARRGGNANFTLITHFDIGAMISSLDILFLGTKTVEK